MSNLPSFEDLRSDMYRLLGDVQDVAQSDWRDGAGPTDRQADAFAEARRHIAAAKVALNLAAR